MLYHNYFVWMLFGRVRKCLGKQYGDLDHFRAEQWLSELIHTYGSWTYISNIHLSPDNTVHVFNYLPSIVHVGFTSNSTGSKVNLSSQTPVAHACNPSYLGGRDQEDHNQNSPRQIVQETLSWKYSTGLVEWLKR
jgi:hypothetical protein